MRRLLSRPAVLLPALVLLSLAGGIAYGAYERVNTSAAEANRELLNELPAFQGARELDRRSETVSGGSLPVASGVLTTVLYEPPAAATPEEVVEFYVASLRGWQAETRTVSLGESGATAYRVDFSRDDDCVTLQTAGMAPGQVEGPRTYTLSAITDEGPCS